MAYRSVHACAAHELSGRLTDAALWLLVELRTASKGTDRHFNVNDLKRRPSITLALQASNADLETIVKELSDLRFLQRSGRRTCKKTRTGNLVCQEFRHARSHLVLEGLLDPTDAEHPDSMGTLRLAVQDACAQNREIGV